MIVGLVSPDFRTCVVRRTGLSVEEPLLSDLGYIHISEFRRAILVQEDVGALQISMEDSDVVERLEATHDLDEDAPDVVFSDILLLLLMRGNFLEEIAVIGVFHYNTTYERSAAKLKLTKGCCWPRR